MKKSLAALALLAVVVTGCAQTEVKGQGADVPHLVNARTLFLRNCAHCHGADARGDDGPDLHRLDLTNDEITHRIRAGKAGQMTAFANKLSPAEIASLVSYVKELK